MILQAQLYFHSIEAVIETDIEDFTNVIPDMIRREITESLFIYIHCIIP